MRWMPTHAERTYLLGYVLVPYVLTIQLNRRLPSTPSGRRFFKAAFAPGVFSADDILLRPFSHIPDFYGSGIPCPFAPRFYLALLRHYELICPCFTRYALL